MPIERPTERLIERLIVFLCVSAIRLTVIKKERKPIHGLYFKPEPPCKNEQAKRRRKRVVNVPKPKHSLEYGLNCTYPNRVTFLTQ